MEVLALTIDRMEGTAALYLTLSLKGEDFISTSEFTYGGPKFIIARRSLI